MGDLMSNSIITYVPQPDFYSCNEACLAMIAGVSIEEAIIVMNKYRGTGSSALYKAFKHYKIDYLSWRSVEGLDELPPLCILLVELQTYNHTLVYYNGMYYDPEFGVLEQCVPEGMITHYLELFIPKVYEGRSLKVKVPQDFQEAFDLDQEAYRKFEALSYPLQVKCIHGISHYKNEIVRQKNIAIQLEKIKNM